MKPSSKNLIWLDLEMTGLNPDKDRILEIATIITDKNLEILAEGPVLVIHQSNYRLSKMDKWNTEHHGASGLIDKVKKSTITEAEAQAQTIEFIEQYVPPGKSPMCGNTIYQDRRFLLKYMPKLEQYFHYRNLDVSTLKILVKRWHSKLMKGLHEKKSKHRALDDIRESINELRYYRDNFLRLPEG
jgi:oligoribonuclease